MVNIALILVGIPFLFVALFYLMAPYETRVSYGLDFGLDNSTYSFVGLLFLILAFFAIMVGASIRG